MVPSQPSGIVRLTGGPAATRLKIGPDFWFSRWQTGPAPMTWSGQLTSGAMRIPGQVLGKWYSHGLMPMSEQRHGILPLPHPCTCQHLLPCPFICPSERTQLGPTNKHRFLISLLIASLLYLHESRFCNSLDVNRTWLFMYISMCEHAFLPISHDLSFWLLLVHLTPT